MSRNLMSVLVAIVASIFGLFVFTASAAPVQAAPQTPVHPVYYAACFSLSDRIGSCDYFGNRHNSFHGDLQPDRYYDEGVFAQMSDGSAVALYARCYGRECLQAIQWHWRTWATHMQSQSSSSLPMAAGLIATQVLAILRKLWRFIIDHGTVIADDEMCYVAQWFIFTAEINPAIHMLSIGNRDIDVDARPTLTRMILNAMPHWMCKLLATLKYLHQRRTVKPWTCRDPRFDYYPGDDQITYTHLQDRIAQDNAFRDALMDVTRIWIDLQPDYDEDGNPLTHAARIERRIEEDIAQYAKWSADPYGPGNPYYQRPLPPVKMYSACETQRAGEEDWPEPEGGYSTDCEPLPF